MSTAPLIFQPFVKYVEFNGRARRSEFWLWVLFLFVLYSAMGALTFMVTFPTIQSIEDDPSAFFSRYFPMIGFVQLVEVAMLLPTIAVGVRRLHDINRSGWWLLLPHGVGMAAAIILLIVLGINMSAIIAAFETGSIENQIPEWIGFGASLIALLFIPMMIAKIVMLIFFVTEGTKGPNRFGQDPKAI